MASARTSSTSSTATRGASRTTSASRSKSAAGEQDALELLKQDHRKVEKMFDQYEKTKDDMSAEDKAELAEMISGELVVHTQVEEEIFYPAARAAGEKELDELLDEAEVEHSGAKDLIAQIEDSSPEDPLFDAKVTVLGEYVKHHVKEEENEMFPLVKKAKGIDLDELGAQMRERADQLKQELGME